MNPSIVLTIFRKEMLDTLRDKRTLFAMIGIPIILYPALFIVASQVAIVQYTKLEEQVSKIAVQGEEWTLVASLLDENEILEVVETDSASADLNEGKLDAVLRIETDAQSMLDAEGTVPIYIDYDATAPSSRKAADRIQDLLREEEDRLLAGRLSTRSLPESFAEPFKVERVNVAPPSKTTGFLLGLILPILMVLMLGVGAFYPAVDLTAGEKERGTFETLLSTPTSKLEIVTGKFLTVFTLSMLAGFLNLASIVATLAFQLTQFIQQSRSEMADIDLMSLSPLSMIAIVLILIPLAFFISAVMMTVALFAKSFKDAQNIVTPFFLAIILPATMGVIPEIELSRTTQFVPIGNITLLFRELMTGTATLEEVFVVFLCTSIYAALALVLATWMFQREEVILSEEKGVPFSFRRSAFIPRSVPTPGLALALFAVVMLMLFYAGAYAQSKDMQTGMILTQYLFILAPVVGILWFARIDLRSALNLRAPPIGALLGVLVLVPGWVILVIQLGIWQAIVLPVPPELIEIMEQLLQRDGREIPLAMLLFIIALSPAICEEVLFRGALLSGLRGKVSGWGVVLIVGIAFGLFHLSIYRVVPTAISGMVLAYVALRSRSIFPAMLGHFMMNASLVLLDTDVMPSAFIEYLENLTLEENGFPPLFLLGAILSFAAGVFIIERSCRRST